MDTEKKIKQKALQLGYTSCGIIPSGVLGDYAKYLDERITSFPESKDLYSNMYNIVSQPENVKSIIVCLSKYTHYKIPNNLNGFYGKYYLFDRRLPYTQEYRAKTEFEVFLNILGLNIIPCGIPERLAAAKAGLGKFGRNNFIYSSEHGSYIAIDAWAVDALLNCDQVQNDIHLPECTDNCNRCIEACPAKALSGAYSMDMGKCITRLNTNAQSSLNEHIEAQMGTWLYGCDLCQDACPLNNNKFRETEEFPLLKDFEELLKPENILSMNEEAFINVVHPRFWYIGKDNFWYWKNNALRCIKNSISG